MPGPNNSFCAVGYAHTSNVQPVAPKLATYTHARGRVSLTMSWSEQRYWSRLTVQASLLPQLSYLYKGVPGVQA